MQTPTFSPVENLVGTGQFKLASAGADLWLLKRKVNERFRSPLRTSQFIFPGHIVRFCIHNRHLEVATQFAERLTTHSLAVYIYTLPVAARCG